MPRIKEDIGAYYMVEWKDWMDAPLGPFSVLTKFKCESCNGTGQIGEEKVYYGRSVGFEECPKCEGEGYIWRRKDAKTKKR